MDGLSCESCKANRVLTVDKQCLCPNGALDRMDVLSDVTVWCQTDSIGIPVVYFADDTNSLIADFGEPIVMSLSSSKQLEPSESNCGLVLSQESLALMGRKPPRCYIGGDESS